MKKIIVETENQTFEAGQIIGLAPFQFAAHKHSLEFVRSQVVDKQHLSLGKVLAPVTFAKGEQVYVFHDGGYVAPAAEKQKRK